MSWLHGSSNPIIHHDLKPSNCLIDDKMRVKISDFGLSVIKPKGEFVSSEVPKGTAIYMAPEVYEGEEYDEKCDVYSFGIILWEIYTRIEPYNDSRQVLSVGAFCDAVCNENFRPDIPDDCPVKIKTLITNCWDPDPDSRPSFTDIVTTLDDVINEEAIVDPTGRIFWKKIFNNKDKVTWNQFIREFSLKFFAGCEKNEISSLLSCIKALFAPHIDEQVTIEQFGKMLDYFGPIRRNGTTSKFLPNLKNIISKSWFHGEIDTNEAGSRLFNKPLGTFLVRFSSTSGRGWFTISLREDSHSNNPGGIKHVRIKHLPLKDEYSVKDTKYNSLIELIENEAEALNLKEPCAGSTFTYFLSKSNSDNGFVD
jgi:serine/threonine protein kinase